MIWRWIHDRSWFRHLFTLGLIRGKRRVRPRSWLDFDIGIRLSTRWDRGMHASEPIRITTWFGKTRRDTGIKDTN